MIISIKLLHIVIIASCSSTATVVVAATFKIAAEGPCHLHIVAIVG